MMDRWKMAWEIYGALKLAGADIGNASVPIISKVLGEYIEDEVPGRYDGNLMRAAPDLLAAGEAALSALTLMNADEGTAGEKLRAAIAAAKGENDGT